MAHILTSPIGRHEGDAPIIRKPGLDERRSALAVLLTGCDRPNDPAVDHFLTFAEQQKLGIDGLWALYDKQSPVSATLIIFGAGGACVVFVSPITLADRIPQAAELLRFVLGVQDPQRISLIQALLEPTQRYERQALTDAGFRFLASLVYMRRSCTRSAGSPAPGCSPDPPSPIRLDGQDLTVLNWDERHRTAFADAILSSYQDTLDCPGLVGVRKIDDIIAGHMAVGRFDPTLWSVYCLDGQPVGVLLLNPLADRPDLELVYLGLRPRFRGRGLAKKLLRWGIAQASAHRCSGMLLAVDEQNAPAVGLYQGMDFRATARKTAMICTLK